MVGYPSVKNADMDNNFDLFCRKIWRKEVNQPGSDTYIYPRTGSIKHINICEKEWRRLGYKDERTWPHLFPSTLIDLPNKWYKMEESWCETFLCHELKENVIKDFNFEPQNENLVETAKHIKAFVHLTENKTLRDN